MKGGIFLKIKRYESNGRFCQAVIHGDILYTSGLVDIEHDSFEAQTRGVFAKIDALIEKYGSLRENILSASVYLQDASNVDEFNSLWLKWVAPGHEPVRTCIVTEMVHPKIQMEIGY